MKVGDVIEVEQSDIKHPYRVLFSLSCQKSAQSDTASNVNTATINTSSVGGKSPGSNVSSTAPQTHLKVGDQAPDFTLTDTNGQPIKLSDFRGKKNVMLAFYVMAFTGG
jgi:cytochrome oxidase Cu insertion factor (SCO1/SenC/PrrC family)